MSNVLKMFKFVSGKYLVYVFHAKGIMEFMPPYMRCDIVQKVEASYAFLMKDLKLQNIYSELNQMPFKNIKEPKR